MKTSMNVAFAGVMLSILALAAVPAYAQEGTIGSFVHCLNSNPPRNIADAVACLPAGCYTTITMSTDSAQPACTLKDGTRLPRVIFSCPVPGSQDQRQRFRPSFTLCTKNGAINHIEIGEDVNRRHGSDDRKFQGLPFVQKMADINIPSDDSFEELTLFGTGELAVLDARTPRNSKACAECHDKLGTLNEGGNEANLFMPIEAEHTQKIVFTNDPFVVAPRVQTPLSVFCGRIPNSTSLSAGQKALAYDLCSQLSAIQLSGGF
ncbi:MAG: hypothetical protein EHM18_13395 [Acidobacteria bacterium]|nr:MAG: hypothetical protein EHM18_13395 [Acidobacteriota bacterium]